MVSPRATRFGRLVVAVVVIWVVAFYSPAFFFRLSLSSDSQIPVSPPPALSHPHHDVDLDSSEDVIPPPVKIGKPEEQETRRAEHFYRDDGLLEVNPDAPHPIFELIGKAEKEWEEKKRRASTSLEEAVKEYRRRYKRSPPKGFDEWWDYVKLHNVQMPDEYDQILHDIEPFWGMNAAELNDIQKGMENEKDSYILGKHPNGTVGVLATAFEEGRYEALIYSAEQILRVLKPIEKKLPSFRATFTPHDNPNRLTDFEIKDTLLIAVGLQEQISRVSLPKPGTLGWLSPCSPTSPARTMPDTFVQSHNHQIKLDFPAPPSVHTPKWPYESNALRYPTYPPDTPRSKTFIHEHIKTMDPCLHPALYWTHGVFLSHLAGPAPQPYMVPQFATCTTSIHHNIRVPTFYGWVNDPWKTENPPWEEREDERLLWRGSDTGIYHNKDARWRQSHRDWFVTWASGARGTVDVLFNAKANETNPIGPPKQMKKAMINPAMVDAGFVGEMQCDEATCEEMKELYPEAKRIGQKEAANYKYAMDIDGNGWSGRFRRLMANNALVFKSTIFPEWYADRVQPWVHYVPIQVDLSDLYDALIFFRGDPNGEGSHEDLAKKIGVQGSEWTQAFWREEDMTAYAYRLLLEYVRVMSHDREEMSYKGEGHES